MRWTQSKRYHLIASQLWIIRKKVQFVEGIKQHTFYTSGLSPATQRLLPSEGFQCETPKQAEVEGASPSPKLLLEYV